jgi:tRNA threonylcarbamoyladenosine biosynthesis protein TsaB
MNFLAFDTSTDVMSIAVGKTGEGTAGNGLADGAAQQWLHTATGGAKASTGLIAGVMDLLHQAGLALTDLDAIAFGAGPGSFTGLRTACSVAQGLAFGADVPVLPIDTLLAVAEEARHTACATSKTLRVTALLDARMDEMYAATYDYADGVWAEVQGSHLVRPEAFAAEASAVAVGIAGAAAPPGAAQVLAGNVFTVYGERLGGLNGITALPTAAAMLRLAPALMAAGKAVPADQALPIYIRDKVAKTTAERMAEKAASAAQ